MALTKRRYTYDEWAASADNTALSELVDGIPVERMSTGGDHAEVVHMLWRWLDRADQAGFGRVYAGPAGALLDPDGARQTVREPDLFFYRQGRAIRRTRKGVEGVPDLVIEVLSPGNRAADLPGGQIWDSYERFGVPRYWIVDPEARTVQQYEHRGSAFVEGALLGPGDMLRCDLFPTLPLPVDEVFRDLPVEGE